MVERDQRLHDAAIQFLDLLESEAPMSIGAFVATVDPELRADVQDYLEEIQATAVELEPVELTPEEQLAMAQAMALARREVFGSQFPSLAPTLSDLRRTTRRSLNAVAQRVDLPPDLLARIERGGVLLATLPERLIASLADVLGRVTHEIRLALATPQRAAMGTRLSAQDGAVVPTEIPVSFAEALAQSTATPAQRAAWQGEG